MMNEKEQMLLEVGNKLGQREMLLNVQRQALANGGVVDLKVLAALSKMCEGAEMIFEVDKYEGVIQRDIRFQSIAIANGNIKIDDTKSPTPEKKVEHDSPITLDKSGEIAINVDGGSRGNPGPSGCACVIKISGKTIRKNKFLGHGTNNEAEYSGVLMAVEKLQELGIEGATVHFVADSQLTMKQLAREWKIKEPRMKKFADEIWSLIADLDLATTFTQVPREQNKEADKLTNMAMDGTIVDETI